MTVPPHEPREADTPPVPTGDQAVEAPVRRSLWRAAGRGLRRTLKFTLLLLAVAIVTTLTVDLGPGVRGAAERAGANYLKRDFTIGRLSIRLLTGRFIVEDLRIGGLEAKHRPFLFARRIDVAMDFTALARRQMLLVE